MDHYDGAESMARQCPSSDLKGGCPGATPLQRRLESVRRQPAPCVPLTPRRRIPQCSQLQEYSRLLNAFFTTEKQKGLAVEVGEDLSIKVTFSTLLGVRGTQRDPDGLLVQILSKSPLPSASREGKVLWTGWLCCVCGDSLLGSVSEDFTCLPLLLANGAESNTAIIGTWFQKTFDCYISPLAISAFNLSWMAAMWTACGTDRCVATTELLWSVPCSPHSLHISYAIHPEDARALWDSVHKTPGEVTQEEVDLFMQCLESHFYRHFRIHLSATKLVRVSTSVASAHTDGKIKILCHKYLVGVLAYLTELAVFQIE
ncbi:centromere protein L isoform X2 [Ochotona princeps]|uniref:centromere protein L isoform X2 n=1 Tax=Ochotona princeps TaxID=9978 RepID=UPI00271463A7|nr:centromere protein L isoform X2 [Ochotona princeps]